MFLKNNNIFTKYNNIFIKFNNMLIKHKQYVYIIYIREYPIRTDVIFQPNKFQAYHFKPLSQFSF